MFSIYTTTDKSKTDKPGKVDTAESRKEAIAVADAYRAADKLHHYFVMNSKFRVIYTTNA